MALSIKCNEISARNVDTIIALKKGQENIQNRKKESITVILRGLRLSFYWSIFRSKQCEIKSFEGGVKALHSETI
jgi:hypothetical protein